MKKLLAFAILSLSFIAMAQASSSGSAIPADEALMLLKDGNARYVAGQPTHSHQGADRRVETAKGGQHPFATIIGCSDSRGPLELIFDQGVGDLFVIRVAGNVAGPDELASVEYGVGHLGTTLVLVLGHTSCDVVAAAVQNTKVHGHMAQLLGQIKPAVAQARTWSPGASGDDLLSKSIKANVWLTMENILRRSQEVREYVKDGRALLVGGVYDIESGQVVWLGQHPEQGRLLAAAEVPAPASAKPKVKPAAKAGDKGEAKPDGADEEPLAKPEARPETKPAAKPTPKAATKPAPREAPKAQAKPAAKAPKQEADPNAHSEGLGELLAPTEKPKGKGAHQ